MKFSVMGNYWAYLSGWKYGQLLTIDFVIFQIAEDLPEMLDSEVPGFADRPISIFIPRLLQVRTELFYTLFEYVLHFELQQQ